jgi:hypothetical protein
MRYSNGKPCKVNPLSGVCYTKREREAVFISCANCRRTLNAAVAVNGCCPQGCAQRAREIEAQVGGR